ncbi:MAG: hypothetical protein ISS70_27295, partial [Phycisphaerae bacterium]|nr:hypothetical protein [Phycisphaerae bacterium]
MNCKVLCVRLHISACLLLGGHQLQAARGQTNALPENLAPKARISADSEHSRDYQVDCEKLGQLIRECGKVYPASYRQYEEHISALERLQRSNGVEQELSHLQREVLLFDVDKLVAIRRHEIQASHVYTYHYEGFKAGGGLYVFDV